MYEPITDPRSPESIARMKRHIDTLGKEYDVSLCFSCETHVGGACPERRQICTPPVTDEKSYAVALHEMGHIKAKDGYLSRREHASGFFLATGLETPNEHRLHSIEERAAWAWAEQHALVWTPTMSAHRDWCLKSYDDARERDAKSYEAFIATPVGQMLLSSLNNVWESVKADMSKQEAA